jgi:hypothetical protein
MMSGQFAGWKIVLTLNLWQEHLKRMNRVLQRNLHRNKFLIVLIKKEYQQRQQTNDIIKSGPNTLCDEYWKDDIQTWPHRDDGMLHSTSKGSGC